MWVSHAKTSLILHRYGVRLRSMAAPSFLSTSTFGAFARLDKISLVHNAFRPIVRQAALRLFRLKLMIAVLLARIRQSHSFQHGLTDLFFCAVNFFSDGKKPVFMGLGNHYHSVAIAAQNVSRQNARITDIDRPVGGFELNAILTCTHGVAATKYGITDFAREVRIAAGAINNSAWDIAAMRHHRQDVAPHRRVFAAAVVDNDHVALRYIIDEVTDGSGWHARWSVKQCEGPAGQTKPGIEWFDTQALTGNAKPVKRIAERGRIEFRGTLYVLIHVFL